MAFTYDISTDAGALRLRIADTDSTAYAFEDDEIAYFLAQGGSVDGGARMAIQVLLTDKARRARRFSVPGMSYDDSAALSELRELWKAVGGGMPVVGSILPGLHPFDSGYQYP